MSAGEAKGKANELAGEAKGKANELSGQAKGKANEYVQSLGESIVMIKSALANSSAQQTRRRSQGKERGGQEKDLKGRLIDGV